MWWLFAILMLPLVDILLVVVGSLWTMSEPPAPPQPTGLTSEEYRKLAPLVREYEARLPIHERE